MSNFPHFIQSKRNNPKTTTVQRLFILILNVLCLYTKVKPLNIAPSILIRGLRLHKQPVFFSKHNQFNRKKLASKGEIAFYSENRRLNGGKQRCATAG